MRYKYYGTAAYEGIPALWCECDVCRRAREAGGKNVMSRSQQTIDNKILIDFSADTFMHSLGGLPLTKIHSCIITHDHSDHLYPSDMLARLGGYAYLKDEAPFTVYAASAGAKHIERVLKKEIEDGLQDRIRVREIEAFRSFEVEEYEIIPLKANHSPVTTPVIYLIKKDEKCILHAHDTGYFPEETWQYLENNPLHLDFVSFDCTLIELFSDNDKMNGHMNFPSVINVRNRLCKMGLIDNHTICAISHFSHNGLCCYDELVRMGEKENLVIAYDGLEIEV